jgi:hypothetical protein
MYGHKVLMSSQTRETFSETHFSHCYVSDIRLWPLTVYSMEKNANTDRLPDFISDLDDVNFPVTVANGISPFGSHLDNIGVI